MTCCEAVVRSWRRRSWCHGWWLVCIAESWLKFELLLWWKLMWLLSCFDRHGCQIRISFEDLLLYILPLLSRRLCELIIASKQRIVVRKLQDSFLARHLLFERLLIESIMRKRTRAQLSLLSSNQLLFIAEALGNWLCCILRGVLRSSRPGLNLSFARKRCINLLFELAFRNP